MRHDFLSARQQVTDGEWLARRCSIEQQEAVEIVDGRGARQCAQREVALFGCAFSLEDRTGDACADGGERDDPKATAVRFGARTWPPVIPQMRARAYRFAREVAPDVVGKCRDRCVALRGFFLRALATMLSMSPHSTRRRRSIVVLRSRAIVPRTSGSADPDDVAAVAASDTSAGEISTIDSTIAAGARVVSPIGCCPTAKGKAAHRARRYPSRS